jgi:hypothetical protein
MTDVDLSALYAALSNAACAAHDAARGYHGSADIALRAASRAAASAFPAGSREAAALDLVLTAISKANEEMLTRQIASDAAADALTAGGA